MNKADYKAFQDRFDEFMRLNELNNLTPVDQAEPFFSWKPCECCLRSLGGDRYQASGYSRTGVVYEFEVCPDCVYYAEYGQLDDMTMLGIGE